MRLHLQLSANKRRVSFNYQHKLLGAFHKWIGKENTLHDSISLYSLSWLLRGRAAGGSLEFPHGAHWLLSLYDEALVASLVEGALRDPEVCYGMRVIQVEGTPEAVGYAWNVGVGHSTGSGFGCLL